MLPEPIIYLDYNATTPVAPEVMNEMLPYYLSNYGNPSSNDHLPGWQAREAVENARAELSRLIGADQHRVIFTAGATESINIILRGLKIAGKNHIITAKTEHSAVLDTCQELEKEGYEVTYLDVNADGNIDLEQLERYISEKTLLVSVMWVNNETGVIQPIENISEVCKKNNTLLMTDSTQAVGKLDMDLSGKSIDISVGSAHKIYGPKGVGFLTIDKKLFRNLAPIITGGGQEFRKRAGTLNVPSIIGLSHAVKLGYELLEDDSESICRLRDSFETTLQQKFDIQINGFKANRLYNTSNIVFSGYDSERIMQAIGNKVAASRGSACSTGEIEPSHVLSAMGLKKSEAHAAIRFSFGRYTTENEVERALDYITSALESISRS